MVSAWWTLDVRLLVVEYTHSGHHFEFLGYILPALIRAGYQVTVGMTDDGYCSPQYKSYLEPFADSFELCSLGVKPCCHSVKPEQSLSQVTVASISAD